MPYLLSVMGVILVLDQFTKYLVLHLMPLHSAKAVIPGFFNLVHVRNTGAAFSILANADPSWRHAFFVCMTVLVVGFLVISYRKVRQDDVWTKTAYALICGGAVGNFVDRLRFREVVDFLDLYIGSYHWPAFNVADSAISVGAVILFISLIRNK
ncbi:MAG: signal peptidase II [Anaerolineaceae bacterium]